MPVYAAPDLMAQVPILMQAAQQGKIDWNEPMSRTLPALLGTPHLPAPETWLDLAWWGPLDTLLREPAVHDVYINGPDRIVLVGRGGVVEPTTLRIHAEWITWLHRLLLWNQLSGVGKHYDTPVRSGYADQPPRPLDGVTSWPAYEVRGGVAAPGAGLRRLRYAITQQTLTPDGASITLRVLPDRWSSLDDLVANGMVIQEVATLLRRALRSDTSILISGGTGSGKTTLAAALKAEMGQRRAVVVQDAPELPTGGDFNDVGYVVPDGDTAAFLRCVRAALRQQPDRIIIGEGRGPEMLAMIEGASTGHPGLTTVHAANAADAVLRVETYAAMAPGVTGEIVRANLGKLNLLMVQVDRIENQRRIVQVAELRSGSKPTPGAAYEIGTAWQWQGGSLQRTDDPLRGLWALEVLQ